MTTIAPNNASIVYSPYTWDVTSVRAKSLGAGSYLRVAFAGDPGVLAATFDMTNQPGGKTRISVRVDGGPWLDVKCAASVALTVPTHNWPTHTVEIVNRATSSGVERWLSPQQPALVFTGLTTTLTVTPRTSRVLPLRVLAVGDSMGEGIIAWDYNPAISEDNHDARFGWAYPLGDMLGAEIGVVAYSGMAWADPAQAGVPKVSTSLPFLWDGQARDITTAVPDAIVINLGTNDVIHGNTDAAVTADVTATLNWLTTRAPTTPIVIVPGWKNYKATAIAAGIAASSKPALVTLVDTTGWWVEADSADNLHPYGYINMIDLAPRVAAIVRSKLSAAAAPNYFIFDAARNPVPVVSG